MKKIILYVIALSILTATIVNAAPKYWVDNATGKVHTPSVIFTGDGSEQTSAGQAAVTVTAPLVKTGNDLTISASTTTQAGSMSAADFAKLAAQAKQFTGTCDGATDATAALTSWIGQGGLLLLKKGSGECMTNTMLTLPAYATLLAEPGATIKASAAINVLTLGNYSRVYGLTIDGGNFGDVAGATCFWANNTAYIDMDDITANYCGFHGFATSGGSTHDISIGTIRTSYCGHRGVNLSEGTYRVNIKNLYGDHNDKADYIIGYTSHENKVENIFSTNVNNSSIWVHMDSYNNQVSNAVISNPVTTTAPMVFIQAHAYSNIISNLTITGARRGVLIKALTVDHPEYGTTNGDTHHNIIGHLNMTGDGDATSVGVQFLSDGAGYLNKNNIISSGTITGFYYGIADDYGYGSASNPASNIAQNNSVINVDLSGTTVPWSMRNSNTLIRTETGRVSIGDAGATLDSVSQLQVSANGENAIATISSAGSGAATMAPKLIFKRSRGTTQAPTSVSSGDTLAQLSTNAVNTNATYEGIRRFMEVDATENWSDTGGGFRMQFYTRPTGSIGAPTERMRIDENGNVGMGASTPAANLQVSKNTPGVDTLIYVENLDNTNSASNSKIRAVTGGANGGDPFFSALINGITQWVWGADNSDSDSFKIAGNSSALGTNDRLTILTSGNVGIGTTAPVTKVEVAGGFAAQAYEVIKTASATLTISEMRGTQISNQGDADDDDIVLTSDDVDSSPGLNFMLNIITAMTGTNYPAFKAAADNKIYLNAIAGSDNGCVRNTSRAVGDVLTCRALTVSAGAVDWFCEATRGTYDTTCP